MARFKAAKQGVVMLVVDATAALRTTDTVVPAEAGHHNKEGLALLRRFTLRVQAKVDGQLKLYVIMHNIEKTGGGACVH